MDNFKELMTAAVASDWVKKPDIVTKRQLDIYRYQKALTANKTVKANVTIKSRWRTAADLVGNKKAAEFLEKLT